MLIFFCLTVLFVIADLGRQVAPKVMYSYHSGVAVLPSVHTLVAGAATCSAGSRGNHPPDHLTASELARSSTVSAIVFNDCVFILRVRARMCFLDGYGLVMPLYRRTELYGS